MTQTFFSRSEAASYLGISISTLARWAMLRTGPTFYKVGNQARYRIADLDAFVESQAVHPVAETN